MLRREVASGIVFIMSRGPSLPQLFVCLFERDESFPYVIPLKTKPKVGFGRSTDRFSSNGTLFEKCNTKEVNPQTSPCTYFIPGEYEPAAQVPRFDEFKDDDDASSEVSFPSKNLSEMRKISSVSVVSTLHKIDEPVPTAPSEGATDGGVDIIRPRKRIRKRAIQKMPQQISPGPGNYEIGSEIFHSKEHYQKICLTRKMYPFNSSTWRLPLYTNAKSPSSSLYATMHNWEDRGMRFHHSFGGPKVLKECIQVVCTPVPKDYCAVCYHLLYLADYMKHLNTSLCRKCYLTDATRIYNKYQLAKYKVTRYCGFMHDHRGTTAKFLRRDKATVKKLITKETYLANYPREYQNSFPTQW